MLGASLGPQPARGTAFGAPGSDAFEPVDDHTLARDPAHRELGRQVLRETLADGADPVVEGNLVTVTPNPLASPHQTAALAALWDELNPLHLSFPETNARLRIRVQAHP